MSVAAILKDLTSMVLQPKITAQPYITGFALSGAGAVEAGTQIASPAYTAGALNPGSYSFGPKTGTGVVASHWKVERITNKGATVVTEVDTASLAAGNDAHDGVAFIIGDSGEDNAVSSLKYHVGTLPEGATSTTVVAYITEAINALSIGDYAKTTEVTAAINAALADYAKTSDVNTSLGKKADKVVKATAGNFAGLDENGNLTDSGKKATDFVAAEAGKRLMTDAEGTKLGGIAEGATKVEKSATNGNIKIDGTEVTVYTEPTDVVHGAIATDTEVTEMLNEVFGTTV